MSIPDELIVLALGLVAVVLVWQAGRVRLTRRQVVFLVAITVAGASGGMALGGRLPGEPVTLLTDAGNTMNGACYLSFIEGELVTDPLAGTAIIGRNGGSTDGRFQVVWPRGWTGRRTLLSGVEILDPRGTVVVRTGTRVHLMGGSYSGSSHAWMACSMAFQI